MDWDKLVGQWQAVLDANARLGGESSELIVEGPATESELAEVEEQLGIALPGSLREVFLTCSKEVSFSWFFPRHFDRPAAIRQASFGELQLSLQRVAWAEWDRRKWIEEVLSTRGDPVLERGWDDVFAFHDTGCGDFLAIDLRDGKPPQVVMLSHDEDRVLDAALGRDFQDFLAAWSAIGCVGPDVHRLGLFLASPTGPLDPEGDNARLWRRTIDL